MKIIHKISSICLLICYCFLLYQGFLLCQFGGIHRRLLRIGIAGIGIILFLILALLTREKKKNDLPDVAEEKHHVSILPWIAFFATIFAASGIIYTAIPYNGALSWKIDALRHEKKIPLTHTNFFADGVDGIFTDIENELTLPDKLYLTNSFSLSFDADGEITSFDTFLYGKDEQGADSTYLISYDRQKSDQITVRLSRNANTTYDEDMQLSPMLTILSLADCQNKVKAWAATYDASSYEILYYGKRSFQTADGIEVLADDNQATQMNGALFSLAYEGGELLAYEVSLHIPGMDDTVTPVRYVIDPEYISTEQLQQESTDEAIQGSKASDSWYVNTDDGSMYYFSDDTTGYRLNIVDAAAGSRFYSLEKTTDGGNFWAALNADPFSGNVGVAEGLFFYNEKTGIIGLTYASQDASTLYLTKDGGVTFGQIAFPLDEVTELPPHSAEYGLSLEDYDYCTMPEQKTDGTITVRLLSSSQETEGLLFSSDDLGNSWHYDGTCY